MRILDKIFKRITEEAGTTDRTDVAVAWWAEKLRGCKNSGLSDAERTDPRNAGYGFAEMLMRLSKPEVTNGQLVIFSKSLHQSITEAAPRILSVDYDPCSELSQALAAAGIPQLIGVLPIKTIMWIDPDKVQVRYGYGSPRETIWTAAPVQKEGE